MYFGLALFAPVAGALAPASALAAGSATYFEDATVTTVDFVGFVAALIALMVKRASSICSVAKKLKRFLDSVSNGHGKTTMSNEENLV
jgi:hypothetical protein